MPFDYFPPVCICVKCKTHTVPSPKQLVRIDSFRKLYMRARGSNRLHILSKYLRYVKSNKFSTC